uniref:Serine/threonine-protein kinase ATR n=1 Tax=Heligmosomoides polygyrus TaxID=6339 RepID=A0A8L8KSU0_HELPZ
LLFYNNFKDRGSPNPASAFFCICRTYGICKGLEFFVVLERLLTVALQHNDDFHSFRLFEVVQRARFNGICLAIHLSKKCSLFGCRLVEHLIAETNILNKSSSRFDVPDCPLLTSVADLLVYHLCGHVLDFDLVFSSCVDWIVDPCQQFSIKLILEWLLVRLAARLPHLKQRLIGLERVFASKRIGSVSSWINMIMLMARMEPDKAACDKFVEIILPWATAQNFAVRCTAIAALRLIFSTIPDVDRTSGKLLRKIVEFDGEPSGNSQRIIENLQVDFYFGHLHPVEHFDLQTILFEFPTRTGLPSEETISVDMLNFNTTAISTTNDDKEFLSAPSLVYSALSKSNSCAPQINDDETSVEVSECGGDSVRTIVRKKLNMYPYRIQRVRMLTERMKAQRLRICKNLLKRFANCTHQAIVFF